MRYAALNQGADYLASHAGFIPRELLDFRANPSFDPAAGRYSDAQLFALAKFLYSLQPPQNPNHLDAVARRGQEVFDRERCASCHTPPLYTNNKLTPAPGFKVPDDLRKTDSILDVSVGTDPTLALRTRRGT